MNTLFRWWYAHLLTKMYSMPKGDLYILDINPKKAARKHSDRMLILQIILWAFWTGQAVHRLVKNRPRYIDIKEVNIYEPLYLGDDKTKWIAHTPNNFMYAILYGLALCEEYSARFNAVNRYQDIFNIYQRQYPRLLSQMPGKGLTVPWTRNLERGTKTKMNVLANEHLNKIQQLSNKLDLQTIPKWRRKEKQNLTVTT